LVCIIQILTTKGPALIWVALILFFSIYQIREKFNVLSIIFITIITLLLGQYQINEYFLNENAPRFLIYKNSVVTANNYFPLGSGLGTYGGEMARRNYSQLYYNYGFNKIWGMNKKYGQFLNDNYWPMILAQFGYFSVIAIVAIYYILFKELYGIKKKKLKTLCVISFIYIMIHSLGSAALTGFEGILVSFIFSFGILYNDNENDLTLL
jgi:hypothetical protein